MKFFYPSSKCYEMLKKSKIKAFKCGYMRKKGWISWTEKHDCGPSTCEGVKLILAAVLLQADCQIEHHLCKGGHTNTYTESQSNTTKPPQNQVIMTMLDYWHNQGTDASAATKPHTLKYTNTNSATQANSNTQTENRKKKPKKVRHQADRKTLEESRYM